MHLKRPTRRRELHHWRNGAGCVAGVDEVGRGPLAGPIVTAAVTLPLDRRPSWLRELRDSKQLTASRRECLALLIEDGALQWGLGWVHAAELDELGMSAALRLACRRALEQLPQAPDVVLADGRDDLRLSCATEMIVKGDVTVASIAAASIIAKVARDRWMVELDARIPGYGFARHKGYGTAQHLAALQSFGPCAEHRRSFAPVAALLRPRLALDAAGA
ncbi:MAG: ribonuclease HII [Chloroflexi bacterium]|nr:ribonuclease HII [Chloroflexota bacterium]MYI04570.1 ribonuclease HII [Chloroflexota bacterium]